MNQPIADPILEAIEHESRRLNHFYLGVEHIFLALLQTDHSLTAFTLKQHQLSPDYVVYLVEQTLGQSPDRRYWSGFRPTPRYQTILEIARTYTTGAVIQERELWLAILDEGDNLPIRVLNSLGVDLQLLVQTAAEGFIQPPEVDETTCQLEGEVALSQLERELICDLFSTHPIAHLEREIPLGQTVDKRFFCQLAGETVLVRIDTPTNILREKHRAQTLLRPFNDPSLAVIHRLTSRPRLAALYYTFASRQTAPTDFLDYIETNGFHLISSLLEQDLYQPLKQTFWTKKERYQLSMWREYEMLLPPALVVEWGETEAKEILHPLQEWSRSDEISRNVPVRLQGFTIGGLFPHRQALHLQAGQGEEAVYQSSKVEIMNLPITPQYVLGKNLHEMQGVVRRTREAILLDQIMLLDPEFSVGTLELDTPLGVFPNPALSVPTLLNYETQACLAPIHGSLRLENILVGDQIHLIHFTHTRRGHILFDWAMLEISLLQDLIAPLLPASWEALWAMSEWLYRLNNQAFPLEELAPNIAESMAGLVTLRKIVQSLLADPNDWREYFAPLTLMGLSALGTTSYPLNSRRLAFIAAILAAEAFRLGNQAKEERV